MVPVLGLALTLAACDRQSSPSSQAGAANGASAQADPPPPKGEEPQGKLDISNRGAPMPDMPFEGPNGETVRLSDFKGKPLLVNLWATWCGPCVHEMPSLDKLADRQKAKLQVMVVSQDMQGREVVSRWWAERDFEMLKPYLDAKADLGFAFNTGMVPTTVLYDAEGKEVWRVIGAMDWDGPRANTLMADTLK
jgi:thiol-disulfide isomerase/thioredoxin